MRLAAARATASKVVRLLERARDWTSFEHTPSVAHCRSALRSERSTRVFAVRPSFGNNDRD